MITTEQYLKEWKDKTPIDLKIQVLNDVFDYFKANDSLRNYDVIDIKQHEGDWYLWSVLAKKKVNKYPEYTGDFTVWKCWNATTDSLNHGYYDLSFDKAIELFNED